MGTQGSRLDGPVSSGGPKQLCIVARHEGRADAFRATVCGKHWGECDEYADWSMDPPLSDRGVKCAAKTAEMIHYVVSSNPSKRVIIICSPYRRCVQTAVYYCQRLQCTNFEEILHEAVGPPPQVVIDYSLGDVYGPGNIDYSIRGKYGQVGGEEAIPEEARNPVRSMEETLNFCKGLGVTVEPDAIGKWPQWPETLQSARKRLATRFLWHVQRSSHSQSNIILVTHADGVGAALSLMPSQAESIVQDVGCGGFFCAKRDRLLFDSDRPPKRQVSPNSTLAQTRSPLAGTEHLLLDVVVGNPILDPEARHTSKPGCVVPAEVASNNFAYLGMQVNRGENAGASMIDAVRVVRSCDELGMTVSDTAHVCGLDEERVSAILHGEPVESYQLPQASDGWEVTTVRIKTRKKETMMARIRKQLNVRRNEVTSVELNRSNRQEQIERLLGCLPNQPVAYELAA